MAVAQAGGPLSFLHQGPFPEGSWLHALTAAAFILHIGGGAVAGPLSATVLWRMCLGLTLAAGSAFTNGFAWLLPGPYHVPGVFFLPQFIPLLLLIFWMIRVRLTGWYKPTSAG
jgi:hypothetical protein